MKIILINSRLLWELQVQDILKFVKDVKDLKGAFVKRKALSKTQRVKYHAVSKIANLIPI